MVVASWTIKQAGHTLYFSTPPLGTFNEKYKSQTWIKLNMQMYLSVIGNETNKVQRLLIAYG